MNYFHLWQWEKATLPKRAYNERSCWIWDIDGSDWYITKLNDSDHLIWLTQNQVRSLFIWQMQWSSAPWDQYLWSFSIISTERFRDNPILLIPPKGINIQPAISKRGYVLEIQTILERMVSRNKEDWINPCLWAIVQDERMQAWVWKQLSNAGYKEIWVAGRCHAFVHEGTLKEIDVLRSFLGIK